MIFPKNLSLIQRIIFDKIVKDYSPDTIEPFTYNGVLAGSALNTYDAKKIYLSLDLSFYCTGAPSGSASHYIGVSDPANAAKNSVRDIQVLWNGLSYEYTGKQLKYDNQFFGRVTPVGNYDQVAFTGLLFNLP